MIHRLLSIYDHWVFTVLRVFFAWEWTSITLYLASVLINLENLWNNTYSVSLYWRKLVMNIWKVQIMLQKLHVVAELLIWYLKVYLMHLNMIGFVYSSISLRKKKLCIVISNGVLLSGNVFFIFFILKSFCTSSWSICCIVFAYAFYIPH